MSDERGEVGELLGAVRREVHPAVGCRLNGGHLDPARLRPRGGRPQAAAKSAKTDGKALMPTPMQSRSATSTWVPTPDVSRAPPGRQRADGGIGAGQPLAQPAAGGQRGLARQPPTPRRTTRGLQRELRRRPVCPGPVRPEGADRHDDLAGRRAKGVGRGELPSGDDDVGRAHGRLLVPPGHRSLRGVQVVEEPGRLGPARSPVAAGSTATTSAPASASILVQ